MFSIHICLFVENTHPNRNLNLDIGGIANQILLLLPSYEKIKDLKISIITKYSKYEPHSNRIKIYELHKFKNYKLGAIYFIIKSFFTILKIHKEDPINIINIHTHDNTLISPFLLKLLYKIPILMKIPLDYTSYFTYFHLLKDNKLITKLINFSWLNFFFKFMVKNIDFMRPINEKMYNDLIKLKYPKNRILRISNGIDSKKFLGINKNPHENTHFGYVGRLIEFKNLRLLLKAFRIYFKNFPNDKLFIYGQGSEENYILKFIHKHNLEHNIILKGFERDKTKIYSNIDVLIDTALGQGISNANMEAMCSNTLVIASKVYGNTDLIKHGKTGLLFDIRNEIDLLKQLNYYKQNGDLVRQILNNAKNEITANYDIDLITKQIYDFLKSRIKIENKKIKK